MSREIIDTASKYLIALVCVAGSFYLIATVPTVDPVQPWALLALIVGWIIRDSAGNTSTANLVRAAQAQPTVTTTGNPPTTTVTPTEPVA